MIGTDTLSLDGRARTAALVSHLREEGMSFAMTSVQSGSDTLCTGVHHSLLSLVCDRCDKGSVAF